MFGSFTVTAALWHVTVRRAEPRSERRPPPHTADSERVWFEVNPIKGQGLQKYKTLGSPDFGTLPNTPRWAERWMRWSYRSALPQTQPCDFIQVRGRGWRGESSLQSQQTRRWRATDNCAHAEHLQAFQWKPGDQRLLEAFFSLYKNKSEFRGFCLCKDFHKDFHKLTKSSGTSLSISWCFDMFYTLNISPFQHVFWYSRRS